MFMTNSTGLTHCFRHRYGGSDGKWVSTRQLGSKMWVRCLLCCFSRTNRSNRGNAAVNLEHRICVIDNVSNGFDIYRLDSGQFVRTLVTREPIKTYPKGVAFANNCQAIIGGSDHGYVYIFERKSGCILGKLAHARNDGVQTIEVGTAHLGGKVWLTLRRFMMAMKLF